MVFFVRFLFSFVVFFDLSVGKHLGAGVPTRAHSASAPRHLFECVNFCYLNFLGIFLWQFHSWLFPIPHANFDSFVKSFYCDLLQLQVQVL